MVDSVCIARANTEEYTRIAKTKEHGIEMITKFFADHPDLDIIRVGMYSNKDIPLSSPDQPEDVKWNVSIVVRNKPEESHGWTVRPY